MEEVQAIGGYKFPPITEAVLEVRFKNPINDKELVTLQKKFKQLYPQESEVKNLDVSLDLDSKVVQNTEEQVGFRFTSHDVSEILVLKREGFIVSELAPYSGWDAFFERFKRDYAVVDKHTGYKEVKQVGLRYINRLDLPIQDGQVRYEDYLNVYVQVPAMMEPISGYSTQVVLQFHDLKSQLRLQSGLVPSPLEGYLSFLFDQDLIRNVDLPNTREDVCDLFEQLRVKKNEVFESSITDKSRELFNVE